MNRKQRKTLESVFAIPTRANVKFSDIEKLLLSLEAQKVEGSGSRVAYIMPNLQRWEAYKPHPQKDARKYQVESLRDFLKGQGYGNE